MRQHVLQQPSGDVEEPVQRGVQYVVPLVVLHEYHHVVAAEPRIVHQHRHVVVGVLLLPLCQCGLGGLGACYVELQQLARAALSFYLGLRGFRGLVVAHVVHHHRQSLACQSLGDGLTDAAAASCYECISHSHSSLITYHSSLLTFHFSLLTSHSSLITYHFSPGVP